MYGGDGVMANSCVSLGKQKERTTGDMEIDVRMILKLILHRGLE
jgi:hypothetical protein